ncbi:MAG: tetratricopeptide repeat protein [Bacteroidales bacterium]|jgi:tetratricopeptide (TPR) repeat protein|nr:tetratricopeptide repeat protein [Bacteroidales bacterium]
MKATSGMILRLLLCLLIVMASWYGHSQAESDQLKIDSLQVRLQSLSRNDTSVVSILKSLSRIYIYKDTRKAIEYAQEAIDESERLKLPADAMIYVYMARAYDRIPDNEKASSTFKKALAVATGQQDTAAMAWVHHAAGIHHYNLRNVPSALFEFEKAIEYGKVLTDRKILASAWFGKALVYNIFEEHEGMFNALQQFLAYADFNSDQRKISDAYRLIGTYYRSINQFQQAIDANQQSFDIAATIGDSALMGGALNHMAWYNYEMGNLDKSLEIYKKNISFYKIGKSNALANVFGNIGNIYRDWERYPEAIDNYNKSIELSKVNHDFYNLSWLYEDISKLYERTGDYRQAYENQKLASLYGDSLSSATYQQMLAGARAQYEADKTAKELELVSVKLQRNRLLVWVLAGGFALIAAVTILLINRFRYKSRQRIEAMNHKISELNQTNLRQQMNPHFIFNTLNSIQYYVFQNDKISSNNYMTKFASLIRKTLENSRHTEIPIKEELDALHLYLELEELRFKKKFDWTISVDDEIDTLAFKIPTMLIQPYVENAITHGLMNKENGMGFLHVVLQLHNDQILCIIEDNGIGRAKAMEIRQQKNNHHQSMGTSITESRLKLVNELYGKSMKVEYTDLMSETGEPAGTKVEINIPIIT